MKTAATKPVSPTSAQSRSAALERVVAVGDLRPPIASPRMPGLQRKGNCACGGNCPRCQTAGTQSRLPAPTKDAEPLPAIVSEVLSSPGQALDPHTRILMESQFGRDFSQVRIHTDAKAAQSAQVLNALAYTVGQDIVFGDQHYDLKSKTGQYLLAHELTHTLQQQGSVGPPRFASNDSSETKDATEREADETAQRIVAGNSPVTTYFTPAPSSIQRLCGPAAIGSVGGCVGLNSDITEVGGSSDHLYFFQVNCDEFLPGEEARLTDFAAQIAPDEVVDVHGFASAEGPEDFNSNLSCQRASVAANVLASAGVQVETQYQHGGTPGPREDRRSVVIVVRSPVIETPTVTPQETAISLANQDCEEITRLYEARRLDTVGLFLQIYRCLTCSFADAIRRGDFEDPLWLARVNHFTFERLKEAFRSPNAEYRHVFAPCNTLDECSSPNQDFFTAVGCGQIMQGTTPLVYFQRCTEGVGEVHLRVDLRDALRTVGCATEVNRRDYATVVPLFQACNRAILSDEFPLGGAIADYIAIPQITEQRDAAWVSAGCHR